MMLFGFILFKWQQTKNLKSGSFVIIANKNPSVWLKDYPGRTEWNQTKRPKYKEVVTKKFKIRHFYLSHEGKKNIPFNIISFFYTKVSARAAPLGNAQIKAPEQSASPDRVCISLWVKVISAAKAEWLSRAAQWMQTYLLSVALGNINTNRSHTSELEKSLIHKTCRWFKGCRFSSGAYFTNQRAKLVKEKKLSVCLFAEEKRRDLKLQNKNRITNSATSSDLITVGFKALWQTLFMSLNNFTLITNKVPIFYITLYDRNKRINNSPNDRYYTFLWKEASYMLLQLHNRNKNRGVCDIFTRRGW